MLLLISLMLLGTQNIDAIKVGTSDVSKIYLGTDEVWVGDQETWTLVIIPDTQRLAPNNPTAYNNMMQWIVDNKETEDIRMVMHLGDYANNGASATEWGRVDTAMNRLHEVVPFIHCAGNHDYDDDGQGATYERATSTYWETVFPASDWSSYDWYVDEYDGVTTNQAATLTIGETKYLFLALEIFPRTAVIAWANSTITSVNPDRIILATHMLVTDLGAHQTDDREDDNANPPSDYSFCDYRADADCASGAELYSSFISQHDNIIVAFNGHDLSLTLGDSGYARRVDTVNGKSINQHFFNFQNVSSSSYAGSAFLRLYRFNHAGRQVSVETYNPVTDTNLTDGENQFTFNYN
jgi:hypothetical protein